MLSGQNLIAGDTGAVWVELHHVKGDIIKIISVFAVYCVHANKLRLN